MTDDPNIVHRWEINNAAVRFATGKVESEEFHEGGFKWTAVVERRPDPPNDKVDFILRCDADNNGHWKCEADVELYLLRVNGMNPHKVFEKKGLSMNVESDSYSTVCGTWWSALLHEYYNAGDKTTFEFRIHIISSEREEPIASFSAPNSRSDVILKIGDNMLHLSKEYLSVHSPVFETMFFGEFAEKGKDEVELKDVVYEEFLDLMQFIYLKTSKITDRKVPHLLKLADQFQMKDALRLVEMHITHSKGFDVARKLLLADQYRLVALQNHCLKSFNSSDDVIGKLNSSPEFANFSNDLKAAICERIMQLSLK